jgi:hypothetical protein
MANRRLLPLTEDLREKLAAIGSTREWIGRGGTIKPFTAGQLSVMRRGRDLSGCDAVATLVKVSPETVRRLLDPVWGQERARRIREVRHAREERMGRTVRSKGEPPAGHTARSLGLLGTGPRPKRGEALYDPERDGPPRYARQEDSILGDPPIGRRQMLEENASRQRGSVQHPNARPWRL